MNALLELGFIDHRLGSKVSGYRTRIWPLEPLIDYFHKAAFDEFVIGTAQEREVHHSQQQDIEQDDLDELDAKPSKGVSGR